MLPVYMYLLTKYITFTNPWVSPAMVYSIEMSLSSSQRRAVSKFFTFRVLTSLESSEAFSIRESLRIAVIYLAGGASAGSSTLPCIRKRRTVMQLVVEAQYFYCFCYCCFRLTFAFYLFLFFIWSESIFTEKKTTLTSCFGLKSLNVQSPPNLRITSHPIIIRNHSSLLKYYHVK